MAMISVRMIAMISVSIGVSSVSMMANMSISLSNNQCEYGGKCEYKMSELVLVIINVSMTANVSVKYQY